MTVDPEVRELLDTWAKKPATPVTQLSAVSVRQDDVDVLNLQRTPSPLHSISDTVIAGPAGKIPIRVYRPRPGQLQPVLYLHGGGFVIDGTGYEAPIRELALASGCLIVAPECRLAPEHQFPAAVDDAHAAARWLCAEAENLGASATSPAIVGDSSGGNLATTVTRTMTREGERPSFQVLIYPMLDATTSSKSYREFATGFGFSAEKSRWYFDQYVPAGVDRRTPLVSPIFADDLGDLPPTLIITAECDPLRDEGELYATRLREAGAQIELHRYPGMIHGFFQLTGALEASRRLHREIGEWMRLRCDTATRPG